MTLIVHAASEGYRVWTSSSTSSRIATSRTRRSLKGTARGAARRPPREHGASRPQWVKSRTLRGLNTPHRRQSLFFIYRICIISIAINV